MDTLLGLRKDLLDKFAQKAESIKFNCELLNLISTKSKSGELFPPYIPFIGKYYDKQKCKILLYSTAQNLKYGDGFWGGYDKNMVKLAERLYYQDNMFNRKYPEDEMSYKDIDINPYRRGVLPVLLQMFLCAQGVEEMANAENIHHYVAISNYYKFSLNNGRDINPESHNFAQKLHSDYYDANDDLVRIEIESLRPDFVISFKGRKVNELASMQKKYGFKLVLINDPAWILRGGSGVFEKGKSWWREAKRVSSKCVDELVERGEEIVNEKYLSKKSQVATYWKKYYNDWSNKRF